MSLIAGTRYPTNRSRLGPFTASNGRISVLAIEAATGALRLYHTTSPSGGWTASGSVAGVAAASGIQAGDVLHVACHIGTEILHLAFDLTTGAQSGATVSITASITQNDVTSQVVDIAREDSGALVVAYGGTGFKSMATIYQRTFYKRSTDSGAVWSAETALDPGGTGTADWYLGGVVKGAGDLIHAFYRTATTAYIHAINAGARGGSVTFTDLDSTLGYAFGKGNSYVDGTVTKVVQPAVRLIGGVRNVWVATFDSAATPTIILTQVSDHVPNGGGAVTTRGTTRHLIYTRNSDNAIFHDTNTGTGWTTDVVRTGTGNRISARVNGDNLDYLYGVGTGELTYAQHTLVAATPPGVPTANAATAITTTGFTANWSAPTTGGTVASYRLDVSIVNTFTSFVTGYQDLDVGNNLSRAVTGLSANTTYYYRVRAVNTGGTSADSNTITTTTLVAISADASGTLPKLTGTSDATVAEPSVTADVSGTLPKLTGTSDASVLAADACIVYAQVFASDRVTALSSEVEVGRFETLTDAFSTASLSLPGVVAGSLTTYKGAELQVRYAYTDNLGTTRIVRLTSAELEILYEVSDTPSFTATVSATLPKLTGTSDATVQEPPGVTSDASAALPKLTGTSDATVVGLTADATGTLPKLSGSAEATVAGLTATASATLPKLTGASDAAVTGILADTTATLPRLFSNSDATTTGLTADATGTLPRLSGLSEATVAGLTATASGTLPILTGSSEATVAEPGGITADASGVLPKLTGTSDATVTAPANVTADATGTLPKLTSSSDATVTDITANTTATLPKFSGSSEATVAGITADATGTLPLLTGSAIAESAPPNYTATMSGIMPGLVGSSTATNAPPSYTAELSGTLPKLSGTSEATVAAASGISATLNRTLPKLTSSITATTGRFDATYSGTLPSLQLFAVGAPAIKPQEATVAATLPKLISNSTGATTVPVYTGDATGILPAFVGSSAGLLDFDKVPGWTITTEAFNSISTVVQSSNNWTFTVPVNPSMTVTAQTSAGWTVTTTADPSLNV